MRVLALMLALLSAGPGGNVERPGTFEIDPVHSSIIFRIRHFDMANFYGLVKAPRGSFDLRDGGSVEVEVEIRNVEGGNENRNRFLAGPDLFNARDYPTAHFRSDSVRARDDGTFEVSGRMTLKGVTRPLTVVLEGYTERDVPRFGHRGAFETTFTIRRSEFNMPTHIEERVLGDEVTITASIEGVRRP